MHVFLCVLLGVLLVSDLRIDWRRYQDPLLRTILIVIGIVEILGVTLLAIVPS